MIRFLQRFSAPAALIALALAAAAAPHAAPPGAHARTDSEARALEGGGAIAVSGFVAGSTEASAGVQRLTIASVDGTFEVDVDAEAVVTVAGGITATASSIEPGVRAAVEGTVRADARVEAEAVALAEAEPTGGEGTAVVRGRVLAAMAASAATDGRTLLVVADGRAERVLEVDAESRLEGSSGEPVAFAELREGLAVVIEAQGSLTGTLHAGAGTAAEPARPTRVRFEGTLRARAADEGGDAGDERWIVGSVLVEVDAAVAATASAAVGETVVVEAARDAEGALALATVEVVIDLAETIDVRGTVEAVSEASVTIDGLTLAIDGGTEVTGELVVGAQAEVRAVHEGEGLLRAELIVAREPGEVTVAFEGTIDHVGLLGGDWVVDGVTVEVDLLTTAITGLVALPGLHAEVSGTLGADGTVMAEAIHVTLDALDGLLVLEGTLAATGDVPGTWTVTIVDALGVELSVPLAVSVDTVIDESAGAASEGAEVQITAEGDLGELLTALVIRVRAGSS